MNEELSGLSKLIENEQGAAISSLNSSASWKNYLDKGAGENNIAGNHQGRYLLELLQNARDANAAKDSAPGRVLVIVTDEAIHVANSGEPFRVDDPKVLDAVCHLSRSNKVNSVGFIGHKGIGMKSILLQAASFSITTRLLIPIGPVRLDFSRSKTADLLSKKLQMTPVSSGKNGNGITESEFYAGLPRLPLFGLPHHDFSQAGESLFSLAGIGVDGQAFLATDSVEDYVTVVSLAFGNTDWKTWLDTARHFLVEHVQDELLKDFDNFKKTYEQLNAGSGIEKVWKDICDLQPEALILMGKLKDVTFVRIDSAGSITGQRKITIQVQPSPIHSDPLIELVTLETSELGKDSSADRYLLIQQAQQTDSDPRNDEDENEKSQTSLLIHIPDSDDDFNYISQPLYMYYPITNQPSGLPFFLHGNFKVNPDRTQLWESSVDHNNAVVKSAAELLQKALPFLGEEKLLQGWLPWILLPIDPGDSTNSFTCETVRIFREMLKGEAWVPTTAGLKKPTEVHFFPHYPLALRLFLYTTPGMTEFALLVDTCLSHYSCEKLRKREQDGKDSFRLGNPALQVGLGGFALDHQNHLAQLDYFYSLLMKFGQSFYGKEDLFPIDELVTVRDIQDYFRAICDLLERTDSKDKEKARLLGKNRVPLLPASINEKTYLVTAWNEDAGDQLDEQRKRVVFYPPYPIDAEGIPQLPSTRIPAYKILKELADLSQKITGFEEDWKVYPYLSLSDEFSRISERMDELNKFSPELIGYLAGLLSKIHPTDESYLYPRPYAHIDLDLLKKTLKQDQDKAFEDLLRLQGWRLVQVPTKDGLEYRAGDVIFGSEWADLIENTENSIWAELIRKNLRIEPQSMQICSLQDPKWAEALRVIQSYGGHISEQEQKQVLFRLLLLLGVRVGPRVEWRWLDPKQQSNIPGLNNQLQLGMYEKGTGSPKNTAFPRDQRFLDLYGPYRNWIRAGNNGPGKTVEFGQYGWQHEASLNNGDPLEQEYLAAIIWFPDFPEALEISTEFGLPEKIDAFTGWYISWISQNSHNPSRILYTGWYSQWKNSSWIKPVPSLASYQVTHLQLWKAALPFDPAKRYPTYAMVPLEESQAVSDDDGPLMGFPCLDLIDSKMQKSIEESLGIVGKDKMDALGATEHLRWLLEQWREGDLDEHGGWRLRTPIWLDLLYSLLEKIAGNEKEPQWNPFLYQSCGLIVPAVQMNAERKMVAVPYKDNKFVRDLQWFDHAPRKWEIDQLSETNFVFVTYDRTLRTKLQSWAIKSKNNKNKSLVLNRKSVPKTQFIHDEESEKEIAKAKNAVLERLYLLIGFLNKSQVKTESPRIRYQQIVDALDKMQVVESLSQDRLLGEEDVLLLSREDYKKWNGPACLAHGLAVLLGVESDQLANFTLALSGAEPEQVELILQAQNIDMGAIYTVLPELNAYSDMYKASRRREQGSSLLSLLGQPTQAFDQIKEGDDVLGLLAELTGLPDDLLNRILDPDTKDDANDISLARTLYSKALSLKQNNHQLRELFDFAFPELAEQLEQTEPVAHFLNWLAAARWLSGPWENETGVSWQAQIRNIRDAIRLASIFKEDLRKLVSSENESLISLEVKSRSALLLEWEESDWKILSDGLKEVVKERLDEISFGDRDLLINCLEEGRLPEIPESPIGGPKYPDINKTELAAKFDYGQLFMFSSWPADGIERLVPGDAVIVEYPHSEGGEGRTGLRPVTLNMQSQGEFAEMFVLEEIWQRFIKQPSPESKLAILDRLIKFRNDHPIRGTKYAWEKLSTELDSKKQELVAASAPGDMKSLFRRIIDVSDVGLAGFDLIDPFGGLSLDGNQSADPCRVEVKSISSLDSARMIMTSHEYHVAKENEGNYVIRVVLVPGESERNDPEKYRLIDFSINELKLEDCLHATIRHGQFDVPLPLAAKGNI